MDPRQQSEAKAEALMASATAEQQQEAERNTRALVRLYPALARVPPSERLAALRLAREAASAAVIPKLLLVFITLTLAAVVALAVTGHWWLASGAFAVSMIAAIARQFIEIGLARNFLDHAPGQE
jgi:hypothetical protein